LKDGLIEESEEYITDAGLQNSSAKVFPKGTLVVALYGASVGKTGILAINAASNQAVCAITPITNRVSTSFLFWFLRYKRPDFLNSSFGAAQPNISQKVLRETLLPVPTIDLQREICNFLEGIEHRQRGKKDLRLPSLPSPLSDITSAVERVEELAARIEEARGLRLEAVKVVESLRASASNALFSSGRNIDWPTVTLSEIADIQSGVTLGRMVNGRRVTLPYLRVANVQDGYLDLRIIKEVDILVDEYEKWQLKPGDILLTEGGDWDKLGRGAVWRGEIPNCIHQNHIFRVRTNPKDFNPDYVAALISSPYGKAYFQGASKQTTNLASINQRQLRAFTIFKPSLSEQQRIVAYLNDIQNKVKSLIQLQSETSAELNALLPSILDKAFKGEL